MGTPWGGWKDLNTAAELGPERREGQKADKTQRRFEFMKWDYYTGMVEKSTGNPETPSGERDRTKIAFSAIPLPRALL